MYGIHYVTSRESDQPIIKETSAASSLTEAISGAKSRISDIHKAVSTDPSRQHPIGFLIFDAGGYALLHREYLDLLRPHSG
jgi:hypothetical protein